jgi:FixJ family two-component response regulator
MKNLRLTQRERSILQLVSEGRSYRFMAERLGISVDAVQHEMHGIYGKVWNWRNLDGRPRWLQRLLPRSKRS